MNKAWPIVRLGSVLRPIAREEQVDALEKYRLLGVRLDGQGPFLRETVTGAQTSAHKLFRVADGDFIYSRLFACRGAFGIVDRALDGCHVSGEFPTFLPIEEHIDLRFLKYWFRLPSVIAKVDSDCAGSTPLTRNRFKESFFLALEIPLPSLAQQRQIVAKIDRLVSYIDEVCALRQEAIAELQILHSKLIGFCFEDFVDKLVPIGSIFRVSTGGTPSRRNPAYWNGDVNWVSSGEVAFCRIHNTKEKITRFGVNDSNAKVYPPSTVLLAMIGQGKTRGQCAILDCAASTNQNVAGIHVYETEHSPEYLYWWLYSNYQKSRSEETGTAQPALSGERVKQMMVPLPSPAEQRRIVDQLDKLQAEVDAVKRLQDETVSELEALMPAILDQAFRGCL